MEGKGGDYVSQRLTASIFVAPVRTVVDIVASVGGERGTRSVVALVPGARLTCKDERTKKRAGLTLFPNDNSFSAPAASLHETSTLLLFARAPYTSLRGAAFYQRYNAVVDPRIQLSARSSRPSLRLTVDGGDVESGQKTCAQQECSCSLHFHRLSSSAFFSCY